MSYLSRLMDETGLRATGSNAASAPGLLPGRPPAGPVQPLEVAEVHEAAPEATQAEMPAPWPERRPLGTSEPSPTAPAVSWSREVPSAPPEGTRWPSTHGLSIPEPLEIDRGTRLVRSSAETSASSGQAGDLAAHLPPITPSTLPIDDRSARALEMIAAVQAWVAAGPVPGQGGQDSPPPGHIVADVPSPFDAVADAGDGLLARSHRPGPGPKVQNVTLSIGTIELTVEAPAQPTVPPSQPPRPAGNDGSARDGATQRLRRHYVNWLGGA